MKLDRVTRIVWLLTVLCMIVTQPAIAERLPNFIIIFTDDQGYGDLGSFGANDLETPNLDRMAAEGIRFTSFYVTSPVCSASRAALMTGSYHSRVGIHGALFPDSEIGINTDETTIAELVKQKGYATAIVGKWHLGDHQKFLPINHGFDHFFGLPYSNDMSPNPSNNPRKGARRYPPLPLIRNDKIIELEPDQSQLVKRYTKDALKFIEENKTNPFLLYFAHISPHVPLYVSESFEGKTKRGIYGDVIAEVDWSVGQILSTLKRLNIDDDTMVIYTSDNGPWKVFGNHGGSCGPLRGSKGTVWECGVRVPFIARWPNKIPAGMVSDEPAATIDILPTLANLIGARMPNNKIDGKDIWPLLSNQPGAKSPHEALFFYYARNELQAMRAGKWKLHFPHRYRTVKQVGKDGMPGVYEYLSTGVELYDLSTDISETKNVASKHPVVVKQMKEMAEEIRWELGDTLTEVKGNSIRPAMYKSFFSKIKSEIKLAIKSVIKSLFE